MPDLSFVQLEILAFAIVVSLISGVVRGFTGFGGPAIMVLALTQFYSPASVLALVLLVDYAANFQLAIGAIRHTQWRLAAPLTLASVVTIPVGIYLLQMIDPILMKRSIALVTGLCVCAMFWKFRYRQDAHILLSVVVGLIGGIIVGATMIALPIMIFIFACPGSATEARANAITWGLLGGAGMIVVFALQGMINLDHLWHAALITVFYMGGAFIGARAFKKASETMFRRIVLLSLLGLSIIGFTT